MKKREGEYSDFERFKRKAQTEDNYFITIFNEDNITTINLSEYRKTFFTFGRDKDNDIIINSENIDYEQGYFEITEYGVLAVNTSKEYSMISNNIPFNDIYLSEGGFIKIVDKDSSDMTNGILFIMSIGQNLDEWKSYNLQSGNNTIGSSGSCDVILPTNGVAKKHALITKMGDEFVAFVGGSGAGKTTFMKCISGVDTPTSGVLLNGENLYENYENLKNNIGYVPQEDIVYSNLTLHDMLKYTVKLRMPENSTKKERMQRIKEVLEIVQLTEFENSYIRQLSGGQRKRASIAVELIADPSLFFLDEPTLLLHQSIWYMLF